MARSVYMCSQPELTLAECSDCSEVKSRVQELEECCDEVRTTLESHIITTEHLLHQRYKGDNDVSDTYM